MNQALLWRVNNIYSIDQFQSIYFNKILDGLFESAPKDIYKKRIITEFLQICGLIESKVINNRHEIFILNTNIFNEKDYPTLEKLFKIGGFSSKIINNKIEVKNLINKEKIKKILTLVINILNNLSNLEINEYIIPNLNNIKKQMGDDENDGIYKLYKEIFDENEKDLHKWTEIINNTDKLKDMLENELTDDKIITMFKSIILPECINLLNKVSSYETHVDDEEEDFLATITRLKTECEILITDLEK
jgi:hypothetical protein